MIAAPSSLIPASVQPPQIAHPLKKKQALIVCDVQPDALRSLVPASTAATLVEAVRIAIECCCLDDDANNDWSIVFQGMQFPEAYGTLHPQHRLLGALKRIHDQLQGRAAHWFLKGHPGAQVEPSLWQTAQQQKKKKNIHCLWRQSHMPSPALVEWLQVHEITHVTLVGIKTSGIVQATAQVLVDVGSNSSDKNNIVPHVTVIRDAIADDCLSRHEAVLEHVLPQYAHMETLEQFVDATVGLERWTARQMCQPRNSGADGGNEEESAAAQHVSNREEDPTGTDTTSTLTQSSILELCDCGRGGHMALYASHLLNTGSRPFLDTTHVHWVKKSWTFVTSPNSVVVCACTLLDGNGWMKKTRFYNWPLNGCPPRMSFEEDDGTLIQQK